MTNQKWLDEINWNTDGLVPVIAKDISTGKVLMHAWMNREALSNTAETRQAVYWSRSRRQLWRKGEQSGHVQHVKEIRLDCDADAILLVVDQEGGIACHTGRQSCFFRKLQDKQWRIVDQVIKDPSEIYGKSGD